MDPNQLGRLMDQLSAPLALYARQWCRDPEDVVQQAFVRLADQSVPIENAAAWLYRVVRNEAINAGKADRVRERHESRAALAREPCFEEPSAGDGLDAEQAQAALETLERVEREMIVAHLWGGLTFEQIAELVGISSSSAHRHYQAGLKALRGRLGASWPTNSKRAKS
jgi:RNA polymerase sigma factor (sigma-70 family)